ncbi:MAG: hypothetical protein ACREVA_02255 [Burkholderiales bacterium]
MAISIVKIGLGVDTIDWNFYLGDDRTVEITWKMNPDCIEVTKDNYNTLANVDVTGMTAILELKILPTSATSVHTFTDVLGLRLNGANSPTFYWDITSADTIDIGIGSFYYDVRFHDTLDKVITPFRGKVKVIQSVSAIP